MDENISLKISKKRVLAATETDISPNRRLRLVSFIIRARTAEKDSL